MMRTLQMILHTVSNVGNEATTRVKDVATSTDEENGSAINTNDD